jgi:hypothetical protein
MSLHSESAVQSLESSILHPDFNILKNNSIFERSAYHRLYFLAVAVLISHLIIVFDTRVCDNVINRYAFLGRASIYFD